MKAHGEGRGGARPGAVAMPPGKRTISQVRSGWGLAVCFLVLLLDGLDTTSIGFVAPVLAGEWNLPVSAFTPAFVATSLGAVVGYVICGPLSKDIGRRTAGLASVALFGLGTLALTMAWDIVSLSVFRFVSAIGLGAAVPITIVAATDLVDDARKETATMLVASGLSAGAVTGGLAGGPLIRAFGWEAVFVLGGLLPLLALPVFARVLGSREARRDRRPRRGPEPTLFAQLFAGRLAARTSLLWSFAFLVFVVTHALIFWTPALLLDLGFERSQAPLATAAFGFGGLAGNLLMVLMVAAIGVKRVLALTTVLTMVCIVAISQTDTSASMTLVLIAGLGAGTISGCIGEAVLAVAFYPPHLRETGVGCATAMGRIGSIAGPAAGGLFLSLGWPARDVFLTALVPSTGALLILAGLGYLLRMPAPRPDACAPRAGHAGTRSRRRVW